MIPSSKLEFRGKVFTTRGIPNDNNVLFFCRIRVLLLKRGVKTLIATKGSSGTSDGVFEN